MDKLVSIVVPVYNVEKYLARCVDSLINQTYKNCEILLVDDGSTDDSGMMCDKYSLLDNRIKVFHKENEGLGLTRNYGIKHSIGSYIMFVDSDDYLDKNAVEMLLKTTTDKDFDLIIGNFIYNDTITDLPILSKEYNLEEIRGEILPKIIGSSPAIFDQLTPSACGKLYNRSFIILNNMKFPSERELIWEDLAFNFDYIKLCNSIYVVDYPVYHYCYNNSSLTHKYDRAKLDKVMFMYQYMKNKINENSMQEDVMNRLNNNFIGHIRTCIKLEVFYEKENGRKYVMNKIKDICSHSCVCSIIKNYPVKYYSIAQRIYSFFIYHQNIYAVYFLTKLQNKRKPIV